MTHGVRRDMFGDTGEASVFANHALDTSCTESAVVAAVAGNIVAAVAQKQWRQVVEPGGEVFFDPFGSLIADEYRPVFLAFAAYHKFSTRGVHVSAVKID